MSFQAVDFAVSCTVTKYIFTLVERAEELVLDVKKSALSYSPFRTRATELRFLPRCPR